MFSMDIFNMMSTDCISLFQESNERNESTLCSARSEVNKPIMSALLLFSIPFRDTPESDNQSSDSYRCVASSSRMSSYGRTKYVGQTIDMDFQLTALCCHSDAVSLRFLQSNHMSIRGQFASLAMFPLINFSTEEQIYQTYQCLVSL